MHWETVRCREIGCEDGRWVELAQDRVQWWASHFIRRTFSDPNVFENSCFLTSEGRIVDGNLSAILLITGYVFSLVASYDAKNTVVRCVLGKWAVRIGDG